MPQLDAATLAQQVTRLGLATREQVQECLEDASAATGSAEPLLRALERKGYLTPFQTEKLKKGDKDGYLLGGYRILYKIASGSFGRVFRGDDPRSGRVVAIKVLRKRWSDDLANVQLFEREGRLGMSIRHPNIVEILSVGRDVPSRQIFIVMEFVEGGNLRDFLAIRKKLVPAEALRFLEDMTSALVAAAAKGLAHRDLKLTNVLISAQGVAKLVDFGLAQVSAHANLAAEDDVNVQRTVDYAGLEKATGVKPGDPRSDIYFLGCIAYEMLTGRSPLLLTRDKHARMQRERFENVPPIHPDEVERHYHVIKLVELMMALNPQIRFQTPSQLLEAVKEARAELTLGGSAWPDPTPEKPRDAHAPTVFLVEKDERLQELIREKLKKVGYRVLISADPSRAVKRFETPGFQCLIVDMGTTGEEGLLAFRAILESAWGLDRKVHGILILSEGQDGWDTNITSDDRISHLASVFKRPLKLGELTMKVKEVAPIAASDG